MARVALKPETSVLVLVDIQPALLKAIHESERVVARSRFLARLANLLEVPVLVTEQNPNRMGTTVEELAPFGNQVFPKMSFSCCGSPEFLEALAATGRKQVVLVGIETQICVALTTLGLLDLGYEVVVCPDALSSRTVERHNMGIQTITDGGAEAAHSETVAYSWLFTAEHPRFRDALTIVKEAG